jgi:hypothetical protein
MQSKQGISMFICCKYIINPPRLYTLSSSFPLRSTASLSILWRKCQVPSSYLPLGKTAGLLLALTEAY